MTTAVRTTAANIAAAAIELLSAQILAVTDQRSSATVTLSVKGTHRTEQRSGKGGVNAAWIAIMEILKDEIDFDQIKFESAGMHSVRKGTDSPAHVHVRIFYHGAEYTGEGEDDDTDLAIVRAIIPALNQILVGGPSH